MTRAVCAAALALLLTLAVGCSPDAPDYRSVWTTTSTTAPPTDAAAPGPVPLAVFLGKAGVTATPATPDSLAGLTVTLPQPAGWHTVVSPNLEPGTRMIAKGDTYPTAMLILFELTGDFDVAGAVQHGFVDAQLSQNFSELNSSTEPWHGFPSAMIEGTYDLNGQRMQTYNRVVFATGTPQKPAPAGTRYLVQLTVTTYADKAAEEAPDIEKIIAGFAVAQT